MNKETALQSADQFILRLINDADDLARRDPLKAMAAAMGVGIAINLLPARGLVALTSASLAVLRPALFTLGMIKALELCSSRTHQPKNTHEQHS